MHQARILKNLLSVILWLLLTSSVTSSVWSQAINIQVLIQPPYSNKLEDYLDKGNNVIITVVNTSPVVQQFKLIPSVVGNNGVSAKINENFLPSSPISMIPGESRIFTFNQLKVYNGNLKQSDFQMVGISYSLLESAGVLPEGAYTLCIKAIEYGGNTVLSGSTGCASFLITSYDPPMILVPQQGADLKLTKPQLFNFQWTPSGISGKTRYRLKLIDLSAVNVFNPNDAFNNPNIATYFEQSNISTNIFSYDISKPALISGRKYAIQITAYDPEGKLSYKNNGRSQAHAFTVSEMGLSAGPVGGGKEEKVKTFEIAGGFKIKDKDGDGGGGGGNPPVDPNDSPDCMSAGACQSTEPSCAGATTPAKGSTVTIGKFKMQIIDIAGGIGTGAVEIPHMQTKVEVSFQNLMVNANLEVCGASSIWAKSASQDLIPDQMLKNIEGVYSDQNLNWQSINQHIQQQNKKVSLFNINQSAKTLPFVVDLGPGELTVLGIVFTPTAAYANIAFSAPIPLGGDNQYFSMGMKGVCIRPNGFGIAEADAKLTLSSNLNTQLGPNVAFVMEGGANGSYVIFDCKGVKEVKLKGAVEFDRNLVLPLDANQKIVPAPQKFKAEFNSSVASMKDWLVEAIASHPGLTSAQGNGFSLGFQKLILDFSKNKNPDGMNFPDNHPLANSPMKSSWTGILLTNPTLTLPEYLKKSNNSSIKLDISSIVLDGEGLWTKVEVQNVIDKMDNGSFGGWGFAISQVSLDIRKSNLHGGGLAGKINIPITEVGVGFDANYEPGTEQKTMKINFGISLQEKLDIDMIFAQASLHESSKFGIEIDGNKVKPTATLHGSLTIGWDKNSAKKPENNEKNDVSSFSLPTLNFQGLSVFNNNADLPQLSLQAMEIANINSQGKLGGFPIKLSGNPGFINNNGEIGLNLGLMFTLSKDNPNGLKGSTDFTIFAKYNNQKRRFAYDRTQINCISIENLDIAVASLSGSLCIFKNDATYGDGFSGSIEASIKGINVSVSAALGVGNVNNYDYFYFEAMVKMPGVPVTATMSLYGFGGGFYYNMTRDDLAPKQQDQYVSANIPSKPGPGYSPSGSKYTPKKGEIGFNATVVFGLSGGIQSAAAFNGDLTLWMVFNKNNGITKMGLKGGGYMMQPLNNRAGKAAISGGFDIKIDFVNKTFDLGINLAVHVAGGIVTGNGDIVMHVSPNEWFIYLGQWDTYASKNNYEPWNDKKRINLNVNLGILSANFNLYFMIGSIVPELPPLPGKLLQNLGMQDGSTFKDPRKPNSDFNEKAPGFAFGAGFRRNIDINILIFYAKIEFFAGFDLLLANYGSKPGCENIGINGWFAKGQAYAYLGVEAGLKLNLWIFKGEFKLIDIKVAALIYAEFPNPNYLYANIRLRAAVLNGLIKVDKQVRFEIGKKMECGGPSSPFDDMPIVSEIYPQDGESAEVYDDIRIAYNFPKDVFKVFNEEDPDMAPKFYYYKVQKIELTKGNTKIPLNEKPIYTNDGYTAKYMTVGNQFYPEKSNLKFTLVVRGYQYKGGGNKDSLVVEEPPYIVHFETKALPNKIPGSQLLSTSPVIRQRYYLKGDFWEGHVQTLPGKDFCYLFNKNNIGDPAIHDQSKTQYLVQFTEMGSGKIIEKPCNCLQGEVKFLTPEELKNKSMYRVRIVARLFGKVKPASSQNNKFDLASNEGGTGSKEVEITKGAYKVSRYLLPKEAPKSIDHIITEWFFQTSMYNTFADKMADYKVAGSSMVRAYSTNLVPIVSKDKDKYKLNIDNCDKCIMPRYDLPVALLTGKEAFDQYDLYGYKVQYGGDTYERGSIFGFYYPDLVKTYHEEYFLKLHTYMKQYMYGFPNAFNYQEGRHYNNALFKDYDVNSKINQVYPINAMAYTNADAVWTFYSKYKYQFTTLSLPNNMTIWTPEGPLTQKEIDEAMAATNFEKNVNYGPLNLKMNIPSPGKGMQHQGLNLKSTNTPVYPIVNLVDLLALHDYNQVIRQSWHYTSNNFKGVVFYAQNEIYPHLFRDKGDYYFKLGNLHSSFRQFKYNWSKNKP